MRAAAVKQESLPGRDPIEVLGQGARLARKYQGRKGGDLLFNVAQGSAVRIIRHLLNRLVAPGFRRPTFGHIH